MKKITLFLMQTHVAALTWSPQGAKPLRHFSYDAVGHADLAEFVQRQQTAQFYILTDLAEEDFQRDLIPHLAKRDQAQLLRRKLEQVFRATPYRRAVVQPRSPAPHTAGVQQDQLQLSALTHRELLDPIVDILLAAHCALDGIYSVALLTQYMLDKLKLNAPHVLLMSCSVAGTLRQSYCTPSGLQFSRLGAFDAQQDIPSQGQFIAEEIRRARQYLSTLHLMGREDQLQVLALFDLHLAAQLPTIAQHLTDDAEQLQLNTQSMLPLLIQKLKLPAHCSSWQDALLAILFTQKIPNQYAPPEMLRYARLYRIALCMRWAAALILLCGLILSGFSLMQANQLQQQLYLNHAQIQREQVRLREHNQKLKSTQSSQSVQPAQIQAAVALYQRDLAHWPDPERTAKRLSQILLDFPMLTLTEFQWQAGGMGAMTAEQQTTANAESTLPRGAQRLIISGQVSDPAAYRQALKEVNRLAERLQQWPNTRVKIVQHPLDIRPEAAVNVPTMASAQAVRVDFVLQVDLAAAAAEGDAP